MLKFYLGFKVIFLVLIRIIRRNGYTKNMLVIFVYYYWGYCLLYYDVIKYYLNEDKCDKFFLKFMFGCGVGEMDFLNFWYVFLYYKMREIIEIFFNFVLVFWKVSVKL